MLIGTHSTNFAAHMRSRNLLPLALLVSTALSAVSAFAGDDDKKTVAPIIQDPLTKGMAEIEVLGGYMHSPVVMGGGKRPEFDYAGGDVRWGYIITPALLDQSFLRGDFEVLLDGFGDGVTSGPGSYLAGGSLLFRYNFFHPGSRIIPYIQAGGGGLHSDAVEDQSQRLIGGDFEFILEGDIGLRFILNDRWSILAEGSFQHISNADTAARNVGVNALGGRVGVGWIY